MVNYHLHPETSVPNRCTGVSACPYGPSYKHYETREAAFEAYEALNLEEIITATPKSVPFLPKDGVYSFLPGEIHVSSLTAEVRTSPDGAILPPGEYWFGDPCYPLGIDDVTWQQWVKIAGDDSEGFAEGISGAYLNDEILVGANTLYGDGTYYDNIGRAYPVDAGCLAPVSSTLIEKMNIDKESLDKIGTWVNHTSAESLTCDDEGVITFGSLIIKTGEDS